MQLRTRNDLVCRQVVELVTDYLEGNLSRRDRRRFDRHLRGCPHCTRYLAQMRATIRTAGTLTEDTIDPDALAEMTARFRRWRSE